MTGVNIFVAFLLLSWLTALANSDRYVQEACKVTRYPGVCVQSLSPFSSKAKTSPSWWARAGVSVTIGEVTPVAAFLVSMKNRGNMSGSSKAALSDCVEVVQDALDNAHRSLDTLRNLNVGEFEFQMSDVLTWLSAALTDEDTCMDGFEGLVGRQVKMIHDKVQNVSYVTSNALALANWLATSGVQALSGT